MDYIPKTLSNSFGNDFRINGTYLLLLSPLDLNSSGIDSVVLLLSLSLPPLSSLSLNYLNFLSVYLHSLSLYLFIIFFFFVLSLSLSFLSPFLSLSLSMHLSPLSLSPPFSLSLSLLFVDVSVALLHASASSGDCLFRLICCYLGLLPFLWAGPSW